MVSMLFRNPQAHSSDLTLLGTLQPWAFGSLNHVETLDSVSNYYLFWPLLWVWYVIRIFALHSVSTITGTICVGVGVWTDQHHPGHAHLVEDGILYLACYWC